MGGDVAGGINEDESSKVAHRVHEVGFATIVGNLARGPKIDMEDIEGAAKRPRKDELAVASDGAVGGDAMGHCNTQAVTSLRQSGQKNRRRMR